MTRANGCWPWGGDTDAVLASLGVATVTVPSPTGNPGTDTASWVGAIADLGAALSFGPCTLFAPDGTYVVDSNQLVIQNLANFTVRSAGHCAIQQAPNRAGNTGNVTGDLFVVADCTDFVIEALVLDGNRDIISPIVPLSASASSGQPSVTVAAGSGASFLVGQRLNLFGGLGTGEQDQAEGLVVGGGSGLVIQSITPGGGTGGGDLITFASNLTHSYAQISSTMSSDGFGPYACQGAYLTFYQTGTGNAVAGRTLGGEDQQNGLHLMNCLRFTVNRCTARNLWESPIKCGNGSTSTTMLTDGCQDGTISDSTGYHAYDQGISLWLSDHITVKGCTVNAAGWAGICMTASDNCTVIGNRSINCVYQVPGDHAEGNGLAIEGGTGNVVHGNYLAGYNNDGMRIILSPLWFHLNSNVANSPTLSTFIAAGTAAGTSVQVSATNHLGQGDRMSIIDGRNTEAVTIASIVDGSHVTFADATRFSHASGLFIGRRIPQENVLSDNVLIGPGTGGAGTNGINCLQVRGVVSGNKISGWGTGYGIALTPTGVSQPSSTFVGGEGCVVKNNVVFGGAGQCIAGYGQSTRQAQGYVIKDNICYKPGSGVSAIDFRAISDSVIEGNTVYSVLGGGQGILLNTQGSTGCNRVKIRGNILRDCTQQGILVNVADDIEISSNVVTSCGSSGTIGQIMLQGVTHSRVTHNTASSGSHAGILLNDGSAIACQYNVIAYNTCRDEGIGKRADTGAGISQGYGIRELGTSNNNVYQGNVLDGATATISVVGGSDVQTRNILAGVIQVS